VREERRDELGTRRARPRAPREPRDLALEGRFAMARDGTEYLMAKRGGSDGGSGAGGNTSARKLLSKRQGLV
jgi:hypothetical protein